MGIGITTFKVTARLELLGSIAVQNVFHVFKLDSELADEADILSDLADYVESIYTELNTIIPDQTSYVDIVVRDIVENVEVGTTAWPTLSVGGSAADFTASGVSAVATAYTFINKVRGRKFFGPLQEGVITSALLTASAVSLVAAAGAAWITPFTGAATTHDFVPGVYSLANGFQSFREVVARAVPGYQRRRKQNVGI